MKEYLMLFYPDNPVNPGCLPAEAEAQAGPDSDNCLEVKMIMIPDPIVEEVRKVRNVHAAKFHNNIDDITRISLMKSAKSHNLRQSAVQTVFYRWFLIK